MSEEVLLEVGVDAVLQDHAESDSHLMDTLVRRVWMIRPYMLAVLALEGIIRQALLLWLVEDMPVEEVVVLGVLDLAVVGNNMATFKIKGKVKVTTIREI